MNFFIPLGDVDAELLDELIDVFDQFHEESEIIALQLEQNNQKSELIIALRYLFEGLLYKSVKLNIPIVSECISNSISLMDHLVEWNLFPARMSDYVLLLVDRVLMVVKDVGTTRVIDIRKCQQILVSLECLIQIYDVEQMDGATLKAIELLVAEYDDYYAGGIEIFGDISCVYTTEAEDTSPQNVAGLTAKNVGPANPEASSINTKSARIHEVMYNPLLQAREWVESEFISSPVALLHNIAENVSLRKAENPYEVIELAIATNIMAGEPMPNNDLAMGICFRDIALAEIPEIINKKEKLTDEEFALIQRHPVISAALLRMFNESEVAAQVVLEHHERLNGSGYPFGLKDGNISDAGKLVGIIDSFNGMIKDRPHKRHTKGLIRAISEINASTKTLYDSSWVKLFNSCIRDYWLPLNSSNSNSE